MKIKKYLTLLAAASLVTACDLDKIPEGDTVLQEQKDEITKLDPAKISGDINSMKAVMTELLDPDEGWGHTGFGVPAIALFTDCSGQDMVSEDHGYNWFATGLVFRDRINTALTNKLIWKTHYKHIKAANDLLKVLYTGKDVAEIKDETANYVGQALASRAYDYLQLIQYYQFTYLGHENAPGLPMVLETLTQEQAVNNPRVTVQAVYDQIMKDLNQAIAFMEEYPMTQADKGQISTGVAYGLRARANMLMGKYAEAAKDAEMALAKSGATPYTIEQLASKPMFVNASAEQSWLWGIVITKQDDVVQTGIINYPSHLCSMTGNGYTTGVGVDFVYKRINSNLYNTMDKSDVRRGWFVINGKEHTVINEKGDTVEHYFDTTSPILLNAFGNDSTSLSGATVGNRWAANPRTYGMGLYPQYTNVKFGPEEDKLMNATNAQDWPLMRAEEMLLIKAEAIGRAQGVAAGKAALEDFVKTYRAPEYTCKAANLEDFINEVWNQRRIELWGEGFSLLDVLRLKKPIIRKGANFSPNVTYEDLPAESPIFIFNIPEIETSVNKGISEDNINEVAVPPVAIM